MRAPREYFRCRYCHRRVMAPRWWNGQSLPCDSCARRSPTMAISASIRLGTYPGRRKDPQ